MSRRYGELWSVCFESGASWCRGVVQLFNALTKAQQAHWNSAVQGEKTDKADRASKAALLKVLQPSKPEEGTKYCCA